MSSSDVVIVAAKRTPIGAFLGALSPLSAVQLGSAAIKAALEAGSVAAPDVQEVIMGCVLPANLGQAPARQAALGAGVPIGVPATTVNKMCGSGLKAVMMAADQIRAGGASIVLAGGLESMSNAPYLLPKARTGYRMGDGQLYDSVLRDGLNDAFSDKHSGWHTEDLVEKYQVTRDAQDRWALEKQQQMFDYPDDGYTEVFLRPDIALRRAREILHRLEQTERA